MKKVFIISYFFPPCNLTAAQRPYSWFLHFNKVGLYPIVITRHWNKKVKNLFDASLPDASPLLIERQDWGEIHYLPYRGTLRDRFLSKFGDRFKIARKLLTIVELFAQYIVPRWNPYSFIQQYAEQLMEETDKPDALIISANPYPQFHIGFSFKAKYNIPWIADYRDAWTTSEISSIGRPKIFRLINKYEAYFEKKWVRTSDLITSVSLPLARNISHMVGRSYAVIENGYENTLFDDLTNSGKFEKFTVSYIGTLYSGQNIDLFLTAALRFIQEYDLQPIQFQLLFPGISLTPDQEQRVRNFNQDLNPYIKTTARIEKEKILEIEKMSHVLLYIAWPTSQGIIPSKIYEYCASGTKILIAPTDKGEVERIVKESRTGSCASTELQIFQYLEQVYTLYKTGEYQNNDTSSEPITKLERSNQSMDLAKLVWKIINSESNPVKA